VRFKFTHRDVVYDQHEHYFVARVDASDISEANRERLERTEICEHRWWSLSEIAASPIGFRPDDLPALLPSILRGDYPDAPLLARVERGARVVTT
jgi:hypothetical protein